MEAQTQANISSLSNALYHHSITHRFWSWMGVVDILLDNVVILLDKDHSRTEEEGDCGEGKSSCDRKEDGDETSLGCMKSNRQSVG